MTLEPAYVLKAIAIGFAAGTFSGVFGVGGGILLTPAMRALLGANPHLAVGTSLAVILPTAVSGAVNYMRAGLIDRGVACRCALGGLVGTAAGSSATVFIHGSVLMLLVSLVLLWTGVDMLAGLSRPKTDAGGVEDGVRRGLPAFSIGLFAGLLSGLVGVGGGFVMVPLFMRVLRMRIKEAFGTSLAVITAVTVPGTAIHAFVDHVDLWLAGLLVAGSVPGAAVGSKLAIRLRESWLKLVFAGLLIVVSVVFGVSELTQLPLTL